MLDEGCGEYSALDVHEALGRIGAQLDTDVGHDATVIGLTTLQRFLDRGLELVADMILRPRFEQREVDRVRDLRLHRLLQLRDLPPAVADRVFAQQLYRGHPYGHMPIGTEASLRGLAFATSAEFHRRAFSPERSTLIAVGDATHDALADAAQRAFSRAGRRRQRRAATRSLDVRVRRASPPSRLAIVHRPGAAQSELRIGHVALRALDARLSCGARAQHDSRRPVHQPHQHEPARGQGLHLRRQDRVRVPPRARSVRAAGERAVRYDGRRHAGGVRRDSRHPRRAARHGRGAREPVAPR